MYVAWRSYAHVHKKREEMRLCQNSGCSYPVFGTDKKTGKGYCKSHQYLRTDTDKRSITQKAMDKGSKRDYSSPRQGMFVREAPVEQIQEKKEAKITLDAWFEEVAKRHTPGGVGFCMECGAQIPMQYMRHATAHLLAKKLFKSVATNDLNYLILCAANGCHDKTHRIDKFVQMKVWPEAAKRINAMLPLLPYDELKYVSQQLYDALENY
jgi:hypothetical protein